MKSVKLADKEFVPYLSEEKVNQKVQEMAKKISVDYADKNPVILGVLNGAFMFLADLSKGLEMESQITFIRLASYSGTETTGKVVELYGLEFDIENRHVIVVEDIIDTGLTMQALKKLLESKKPASVKLAVFLIKPEALRCEMEVDYLGFEIPNDFVIGYGMDYDGYGRNLASIFQLK
ncbi:MAG: hypoxanthine phosphoribosyltransferase [Arenicella sp.]|jgi:hypoxanthine phosphoribosyltransferase